MSGGEGWGRNEGSRWWRTGKRGVKSDLRVRDVEEIILEKAYVADTARLRRCHLGCYSTLTLQFFLVSIERLLSAIFEVSAVVVFWQTMLWRNRTNLDISGGVSEHYYYVPCHRIGPDSVGIVQQCEGRRKGRDLQLRTGSVSWQPLDLNQVLGERSL